MINSINDYMVYQCKKMVTALEYHKEMIYVLFKGKLIKKRGVCKFAHLLLKDVLLNNSILYFITFVRKNQDLFYRWGEIFLLN